MNKIILILVLFFSFYFSNNVFAQVEKKYVVVEIGTGTWCGYCPGAAMAADDLVENGQQVAIIENHNGDSYANTASNGRNTFNGIPAFPTAYFNGEFQTVGASATSSVYSTYLPKYNAAKAKMSDFTLDLSYIHTGLDYEVTINLDEIAEYAGTNLKVQLALTESHIPETWGVGGIMDELNFVNRAMYPSHNGTSYSGGTETFTINFTVNPSWDLEHCELVAFVQDISTKEILQVDKKSLAEPVGINNASVSYIVPIIDNCNGLISPTIRVKNKGNASISSFNLEYSINDGATTGTQSWAGEPFGLFDEVDVTIDEVSFDLLDENNISFTITEVNDGSDDDVSDNTEVYDFNRALVLDSEILHIHISTDDHGDECTWNVVNSSGEIAAAGGPYENNANINETLSLPADCYNVTIFDSGNNGGGTVAAYDDISTILFLFSGGNYGAAASANFTSPGFTGVEAQVFNEAMIFPNPTNNLLNIINATGLHFELYDILGRKVLSKTALTSEELVDVSALTEGTYYLKLTDDENVRTEKIVILRK